MKNWISFIFRYLLYWLLIFFCGRFLFSIIQCFQGQRLTVKDYVTSFIVGLRMDLSMAAYIIVPVLLFLVIHSFMHFKNINKIIRIYSLIILVLVVIIYAVDCELYQDWGFRMDYTPFLYLQQANEAKNFLTGKMIFVFLISFVSLIILSLFFLRRITHINHPQSNWKWAGIFFLSIPLMIIPMRGGVSQVPLNTGHAYFSSNIFANHLAINPVWNIFYSYRQRKKIASSTQFMDSNKAHELVASLYTKPDTADVKVLSTTRPDIIIMIIESFTRNMINQSYEGKEITPCLNKIIKDGIFFANAYGSGERTDKGTVCVLSGYPAQPQSSIMMYQNKCDKLPSLAKALNQLGYHSNYYYGGDLGLASMKSYLLGAGFTKIIDKDYFPKNTYNAKWGVHDHIVLEKAFHDIQQERSPFFTTILTLSSHPPYDVPVDNYWELKNEEVQFLNSAHYTDASIGKFVDQLKASDKWNNTLLILAADHGGRFPAQMEYNLDNKFKISFHWTGGAVTKDSVIHTLALHSDIPKSVLHQMNVSATQFTFSQDLFNTRKNPFVYYAFNNGVGWIDSLGLRVFSNDKKEFIITKGKPYTSEESVKAFLQVLMEDFDKR